MVSAAGAFAIDAATFFISALTLIGIQRGARKPAAITDPGDHRGEVDTLRGLWTNSRSYG